MKDETINQELKEMSLEARLGILTLNSAAFGATAYGIFDQIARGHYIGGAVAAILCVGNAIGVGYNIIKTSEDFKK